MSAERQSLRVCVQVGLLKDALAKAGLPLYLAPYGVLPTAYECGIIEVRRPYSKMTHIFHRRLNWHYHQPTDHHTPGSPCKPTALALMPSSHKAVYLCSRMFAQGVTPLTCFAGSECRD